MPVFLPEEYHDRLSGEAGKDVVVPLPTGRFLDQSDLDLAFFQRSEDHSVGVRALSVAPKESREHRQSCLAVWIQISSQKLPDNLLILALSIDTVFTVIKW